MANTEDRVNHPSHYTWLKELCGIEVIDITRHMDFDLGNVVKYVLRSGHKEEADMTPIEKQVEDLKKAEWYLNDKITQLQLQMAKQLQAKVKIIPMPDNQNIICD